jgi:hypothetical protein
MKKWMAIGVGVMFLTLVVSGGSQVKRAPRTHREAVMQVLDRHDVHYHHVEVSDFCPSLPYCMRADTLNVPMIATVTISGMRPTQGHIRCAQRGRRNNSWKGCTLSLPAFNLRDFSLPPLADDPLWFVLLDRYWQELTDRFGPFPALTLSDEY